MTFSRSYTKLEAALSAETGSASIRLGCVLLCSECPLPFLTKAPPHWRTANEPRESRPKTARAGPTARAEVALLLRTGLLSKNEEEDRTFWEFSGEESKLPEQGLWI